MAENTHNLELSTADLKEKLPWKHHWVVENDNSMARDQFAVERNFLSWFKLAMAIVASGTVIYKDFNDTIGMYSQLARISTAYFLGLAIVLLILSTVYLYAIKAALTKENGPLKLFHPLFLQVAGCIGAVSLIFVLALAYHRQEMTNS
ncbi:hypothetical protein IW140_005670 [Coemansia sp. RSA 1813]|nr:hypothetical protein EV178_005234 [Coemansia sp. RSA 1646]KAJ1767759.1 hypothetical protein LPJ74_005187 [Coemansia sp. RSA 1843]KAJ2087067.1 hypothetical protein IW138_005224 [Coemansia sp. RSA 986]KAJ2564645.1 hypothetical protein IW140_005670 [Coemansia sp. RSA 1813]